MKRMKFFNFFDQD